MTSGASISAAMTSDEKLRERWSRFERQVADVRLIVFSVGLMLAFFVYRTPGPSVLADRSGRLVHRSGGRARAVPPAQRARPDGDGLLCQGAGPAGRSLGRHGSTGLGLLDLNHPYAADLDLFGAGSLFERLCTARTRAGEEAIASWLLAPAPLDTLAERHEAIGELRPRLDLREDLELLGTDVRSGIDPEALARWGRAPRAFPGNSLRITAAILAGLGSIAVLGWAFLDTSSIPLLLVLATEIAFAYWLANRVRHVLTAVDERAHDLVLLGDLLDRLERESAQSVVARAAERHSRLRAGPLPCKFAASPACCICSTLARTSCSFRSRPSCSGRPSSPWRSMPGVVPKGLPSPAGSRPSAEFEALSALAAYAAENPADPFPEIVTAGSHV